VTPGHYVASSIQGRYVTFDVQADGRSLINLRVEFNAACQPSGTLENGFYTVGSAVPIAGDRTFTSNTRTSSGNAAMNIRGTFDTAGNVSGTFQGHVSLDSQGTHYECDSGTVSYSGRRQ
jgi:hypothetical protein